MYGERNANQRQRVDEKYKKKKYIFLLHVYLCDVPVGCVCRSVDLVPVYTFLMFA